MKHKFERNYIYSNLNDNNTIKKKKILLKYSTTADANCLSIDNSININENDFFYFLNNICSSENIIIEKFIFYSCYKNLDKIENDDIIIFNSNYGNASLVNNIEQYLDINGIYINDNILGFNGFSFRMNNIFLELINNYNQMTVEYFNTKFNYSINENKIIKKSENQKSGIVSMNYVGRLGNILLQYLYLRNLAKYKNYYFQSGLIYIDDKFIPLPYSNNISQRLPINNVKSVIHNFENFNEIKQDNHNYLTGYFQNTLNILDKEILNETIQALDSISNPKKYKVAVHIRCGDQCGYPTHNYQPILPISYYIHILDRYSINDVVFITENLNDTYILELKKYFKDYNFISNSCLDDFNHLRQAETIVMSCSTFSLTSVLLSDTYKTVYFPVCGFWKQENFINSENGSFSFIKNSRIIYYDFTDDLYINNWLGDNNDFNKIVDINYKPFRLIGSYYELIMNNHRLKEYIMYSNLVNNEIKNRYVKHTLPLLDNISVELMGGVGNQIFQVINTYFLSRKVYKNFVISKEYTLTSNHSDINYLDNIFKYFNKIDKIENYKVITERFFNYMDDHIYLKYENSNNIFKSVYLQDISRYVPNKYKELIYNMLKIHSFKPSKYNFDIDNSAFFHIRLGDAVKYVSTKDGTIRTGNQYHFIPLNNYYVYCINELIKKNNNIKFIVVSDTIDEIFNYYPELENYKDRFVLTYNLNELETIYIMANTKLGGICSNSTLSYWGGFLNNNPENIYWPNVQNKFFENIYLNGVNMINPYLTWFKNNNIEKDENFDGYILLVLATYKDYFQFEINNRDILAKLNNVKIFYLIADNAINNQCEQIDNILKIKCDEKYINLSIKSYAGFTFICQKFPMTKGVFKMDSNIILCKKIINLINHDELINIDFCGKTAEVMSYLPDYYLQSKGEFNRGILKNINTDLKSIYFVGGPNYYIGKTGINCIRKNYINFIMFHLEDFSISVNLNFNNIFPKDFPLYIDINNHENINSEDNYSIHYADDLYSERSTYKETLNDKDILNKNILNKNILKKFKR